MKADEISLSDGNRTEEAQSTECLILPFHSFGRNFEVG